MRLYGKALGCSFCGKSQHDVQKLIAGPAVFICDECITICVGILEEGGPAPRPSAPMQKRRLLDRVRDWFAFVRKDEALCTLSRFTR